MQKRKIRAGIIISLVLAVAVSVLLSLYADVPKMLQALTNFRWEFLPVILGLTLFNYLGRFVKWQYYLSCLQIRLPWWRSLLIFLSGLSMAITPGKVGELLKSYYLKRSTETPISQTAPIIFAERLSDGLAMFLLASTGLFLYQWGLPFLFSLVAIALVCILLIQNQKLVMKLLQWGRGVRLISRFVPILESLYSSTFRLLRWQSLLIAVTLGIISWAGECGALYFVYIGLGIEGSGDLFLKSIFILAVSSLIGSASGLPGGLGTADGSVLVLTQLLVTPINAISAAATFIIRFCTLWFGLLIGVIAVLFYHLTQAKKPQTPTDPNSSNEQDSPLTLSTQSGYNGN